MKIMKNGLIISCQALEDEPLHSSFIMGRMALAAKEAGAIGIRANSIVDILEIKKIVDLPIIGIIKNKNYNSSIFITPSLKEIKDLLAVDVEIIALDASLEKRPHGEKLEEVIQYIRKNKPQQLIMADCNNYKEIENADKLGFDFVATTLYGDNKKTKESRIIENDNFELKKILANIKTPLIVEGGIKTPEELQAIYDLHPYSIVIGSAITRPQVIAKRFVDVIKKNK